LNRPQALYLAFLALSGLAFLGWLYGVPFWSMAFAGQADITDIVIMAILDLLTVGGILLAGLGLWMLYDMLGGK